MTGLGLTKPLRSQLGMSFSSWKTMISAVVNETSLIVLLFYTYPTSYRKLQI